MSPDSPNPSIPRGRFAALALALALLSPSLARADADAAFTYDADVVWSTAVRLLRVDLGYDIAELDHDNGYLLFVIHENGRDYNGSLEFVPGEGEHGVAAIELTLRISGLPVSAEETVLRKLRTKLREDYGLPPRAPAAVPEPPPPPPGDDEGTTGDDSAEGAADGTTAGSE